jgi:hypothetical protein
MLNGQRYPFIDRTNSTGQVEINMGLVKPTPDHKITVELFLEAAW